ncbi:MAG: ABC transporter substrate-binding protein, partial [Alphaproteobacteria bacterium]|nr:ABC transporter substrate-binding protein [Alphaproteobacteria bacterium]
MRVVAVLICLIGAAAPGIALELIEPPMLAQQVAAGRLPPIAQRLPQSPAVAALDQPDQTPGTHGGSIRMLMGAARDMRFLVVYGYARLVGYDRNFELVPDIFERFEVEQGRIFTFHLRPGHRWSDGQPFTAEDFRFAWEDIQLNKELSPSGVSVDFLADGEPPRFEVLSPTAVRYTWPKPNPGFLAAIAGPRPLDLAKPAHYLRQFHQ